MTSENNIKQVLDLLTTAPKAELESLKFGATAHANNMRSILDDKNVVAIGISEKISNGKKTGKLALMFYVEKKIPLSKLKGNKVIPPTVPESISGTKAVPTDVIAIGKLKPEAKAAAGLPNKNRHPLQPGNSIGHVDITAGTFGAVVKKGNQQFLLSNSHVLAKSGTAKKGDQIIYPGHADGGQPPADMVASLEKFAPFVKGKDFVNFVDCAIAKPLPDKLSELTAEIKDLGFPTGITTAKRGMKVTKVGRTSGKTVGEVKDVHFRFVLTYDEGVGDVGYTDQVWCSRYTAGGDSGSLVLEDGTNKAVGLHFAGANGGSVFNPIDKVLSALDVELVTGSGSGPQAARSKTKKAAKKKTKAHGVRKTGKSGKR